MDLTDCHVPPARVAAAGPAWAWLLLALLAPLGAHAGTWKCKTADGGVAYINNHVSDYKSCVRIANMGGDDSTHAPAASPASGQWQYREARAGETLPTAASKPSTRESKQDTRVVKGSVYRVKRRDGVFEYTNIKPRGDAGSVALLFHYISTCQACDVHSTLDWDSVPLKLTVYAAQISKAAHDFGIDGSLLRALIHAESAFDPRALSVKGAQGLTQLMPKTAISLGVADAFDPEQNIRGGARYLARLLKDFNGDSRLATAAYNAGEGAVRKYGGVPPYAETRVYVDRVALLAKRYRSAQAGQPLAGIMSAAAR